MNKKRLIALLTAAVLTAVFAFAMPSATAAEPQLGDVNHDDVISTSDARSVLRAAVALDDYDETFFVYADVNKSNAVDTGDARAILRAAVGLETIVCITTIEDVMQAADQQELNRHAYRSAIVGEGYTGTMEEWMASLKGKDGLSAYEIAVKLGFDGTEEEWLASLKGEDGKTPNIGDNGNWWIDGTDTGIKAEGQDGVSVVDSYVDENYHLWIVLSDGNKIDAGYVGVQIPVQPTDPSEPSSNPSEPSTEPSDPSTDPVEPSTEPTTTPEEPNGPTVTVSSATAKAGDKNVRITLNMSDNPGILGMTLSLSYDEDAMTLVGVEKGSALNEMTFTTPKNLGSGCKLPWDAEEVLPEDATNGEMVTLIFNISETASVGRHRIMLTYDNGAVVDNDLNIVDLVIVNGSITIE